MRKTYVLFVLVVIRIIYSKYCINTHIYIIGFYWLARSREQTQFRERTWIRSAIRKSAQDKLASGFN
jgi:hypothetical protein